METGRRLNIIKEINYESAIPRIIEDIKARNAFSIKRFSIFSRRWYV